MSGNPYAPPEAVVVDPESSGRRLWVGMALAFLGALLAQSLIYVAIMFPYFRAVDPEYFGYGFLGIVLASGIAAVVGWVTSRFGRLPSFIAGAVAGPLISGVGVLLTT